MLDKRLTKFGSVTIDGHKSILVEGFDGNDCMCREVAALALVWAIGELQRELNCLIAVPGGTGKCIVD
jgi:hypothetical protein